MWLSAIKLAVQAGSHIYKKKKHTQMLMADAQAKHAEKMARGELEYKAKVIESNDNGWKDEFVLVLVSLAYSCYWVGLCSLTILRFVIE